MQRTRTTRPPCRAVGVALAVLILSGRFAACLSQRLPAIYQLGPVEHSSNVLLPSVSAARALHDGRVLVHDLAGRQLLLFDAALSSSSVIANATSAEYPSGVLRRRHG